MIYGAVSHLHLSVTAPSDFSFLVSRSSFLVSRWRCDIGPLGFCFFRVGVVSFMISACSMFSVVCMLRMAVFREHLPIDSRSCDKAEGYRSFL